MQIMYVTVPCEIHQVELSVPDDFLPLHVALLDHDLHREDAVAAGGVLIAERGRGLPLLDAPLQDLEDVSHAEHCDLLQVLADHTLLHILAQLQLLLAGNVE